MEYFISHLGIIIIAAVFVAVCAVAWWFLTERNAMLIRQRAEARKKAASVAAKTEVSETDKEK